MIYSKNVNLASFGGMHYLISTGADINLNHETLTKISTYTDKHIKQFLFRNIEHFCNYFQTQLPQELNYLKDDSFSDKIGDKIILEHIQDSQIYHAHFTNQPNLLKLLHLCELPFVVMPVTNPVKDSNPELYESQIDRIVAKYNLVTIASHFLGPKAKVVRIVS